MGLLQIILIVFCLIIFVTCFISTVRSLNNIGTYLVSGWFKHAASYVGWFILQLVIASMAIHFIINSTFIFN